MTSVSGTQVKISEISILEYKGSKQIYTSPFTTTPLTLDKCEIKTYSINQTIFRIQVNPFFDNISALIPCSYLIGVYKYGDPNAGYSYPDLG
jgi:hypothetical protein